MNIPDPLFVIFVEENPAKEKIGDKIKM